MEKILLVNIIGGVCGAIAGMNARDFRELCFFNAGVVVSVIIGAIAFLV